MEGQTLNPNDMASWIRRMPLLAYSVRLYGINRGFSTLVILSVPVAVWNYLPDELGVAFVGYATSQNQLLDGFRQFQIGKEDTENEMTSPTPIGKVPSSSVLHSPKLPPAVHADANYGVFAAIKSSSWGLDKEDGTACAWFLKRVIALLTGFINLANKSPGELVHPAKEFLSTFDIRPKATVHFKKEKYFLIIWLVVSYEPELRDLRCTYPLYLIDEAKTT